MLNSPHVASAELTLDYRAPARYTGKRLGRYQVGARLGSGGAASVYLARLEGPHNFERLLALKIVHEHLLEEREFVDMFLDEANLAVRLNHPNVVHVYELARAGDALFMALEYLEGQPLSAVYPRAVKSGTPLPPDVVAWIGAKAADGLHHAHELTDDDGVAVQLVHRDVSPDNIFLTYDGQVRVLDFGIAKAAGRIAKTALGKVKGKYRYMAPEQALGRDYDRRVDVFALGASLYEALAGRPLFEGEDEVDTLSRILEGDVPDLAERIPGFAPEFMSVLRRALALEPDDRFPTADDFAQQLASFVRSTGRTDQRQRLTSLLATLFDEDRVRQAMAVAELREDARRHSDAQPASVTVRPGVSSKRSRWPVVAVGATAVAIVGAVVATRARGSHAPAPAASAAPTSVAASTVRLTVRWSPDVEAQVRVDGRPIDRRPVVLDLEPSKRPFPVEVSAPGRAPAKVTVVADRPIDVVVPLGSVPSAAPPSPPPPQVSAPPPVRAPAPAPARAPAGKDPPPAAPAQKGKLITDSPF